jgi:hypothetical protein
MSCTSGSSCSGGWACSCGRVGTATSNDSHGAHLGSGDSKLLRSGLYTGSALRATRKTRGSPDSDLLRRGLNLRLPGGRGSGCSGGFSGSRQHNRGMRVVVAYSGPTGTTTAAAASPATSTATPHQLPLLICPDHRGWWRRIRHHRCRCACDAKLH